jgi:hypothetical protein
MSIVDKPCLLVLKIWTVEEIRNIKALFEPGSSNTLLARLNGHHISIYLYANKLNKKICKRNIERNIQKKDIKESKTATSTDHCVSHVQCLV